MESERQTYQVLNIFTRRPDAALIGEILRCAQDDRVGAKGVAGASQIVGTIALTGGSPAATTSCSTCL